MKKICVQFVFVLLLSLLFWGCDKNRVFEDYQKIPESGWQKDSLVSFLIPISDTFQNHNLLVNVRNDISYNYSNLWLFIEINQPGGITSKDTFEIRLADPSGKWLGEGFGGIKTLQRIYKRSVYFPFSGEYKINMQHAMRESNLEGLTDIGFRVEKLN